MRRMLTARFTRFVTLCRIHGIRWGVILSATDCLNWFAGITDKTPPELTAEIGDEVQAPGHVIFLPYLSGERTPHNDAEIRGQFLNLSHRTDRADMTRAILEAVAFAFRDSLEALAVAGTQLDRVMGCGRWIVVVLLASGAGGCAEYAGRFAQRRGFRGSLRRREIWFDRGNGCVSR